MKTYISPKIAVIDLESEMAILAVSTPGIDTSTTVDNQEDIW